MLTFTKSMLALSVMAAVAGANAATYTEDTTLTDKIFTEGIMAINGATVTVTGDEIAGKWFKATNYSQDVGSKYSYEQSKLLLGNADTKKITINNSSKDLGKLFKSPLLFCAPRAFIYYTGQISVQTIVQGTFEELPLFRD